MAWSCERIQGIKISLVFLFLLGLFGWSEGVGASEGRTNCSPDGLNIRCLKTGYEADTLTINNNQHCSDGSVCHPIFYNIAVNYSRCGRPGKNVKNYNGRYLRPYEAYSYHFAKADPNKCLEYVIHTCSKNSRHSRPINCSQFFHITTY